MSERARGVGRAGGGRVEGEDGRRGMASSCRSKGFLAAVMAAFGC